MKMEKDYVLPEGAMPNANSTLITINPHDKFKRKKGLNYKEYSEFNNICSLTNDQIIYCYNWLDRDMLPEEFKLRCKVCPYAKNLDLRVPLYNTNRYPYFIINREEYEADDPKSYVYFITDGHYVKIGVAKNPEKRVVELQVGNPNILTVLCKIPTKTEKEAYNLEKYLHLQYEAFQKNGEWFDILNHIKVKEFVTMFN